MGIMAEELLPHMAIVLYRFSGGFFSFGQPSFCFSELMTNYRVTRELVSLINSLATPVYPDIFWGL